MRAVAHGRRRLMILEAISRDVAAESNVVPLCSRRPYPSRTPPQVGASKGATGVSTRGQCVELELEASRPGAGQLFRALHQEASGFADAGARWRRPDACPLHRMPAARDARPNLSSQPVYAMVTQMRQ